MTEFICKPSSVLQYCRVFLGSSRREKKKKRTVDLDRILKRVGDPVESEKAEAVWQAIEGFVPGFQKRDCD